MSTTVLRDKREIFRDELVMRDRIAALLGSGPKTVPELAAALGRPAYEVMAWVAAMRRYGRIEERGKADGEGYFAYALKG
jgi:predicted Rossmann fold nucleotide-binding protein DprA/Smf involved in DNA uptake